MAYVPKVGDKVQYVALAEVVAISGTGREVLVKSLMGEPKDQTTMLPIETLQVLQQLKK